MKTIVLFFSLTLSGHAYGNVYQNIASSREEINSSKCQLAAKTEKDTDHYLEVIKKIKDNDQTRTQSVGGITFKDGSQKLGAAYKYLTSHLDYKLRPARDIDYWWLFKDGRCQDAPCAASEVFGSDKGAFYLGFLLETGLSLSTLGYSKLEVPLFNDETVAPEERVAEFNAYYKVREWEQDELTPYLKGIYSLPKSLYPLPPTRFSMGTHDHHRGKQVHSNATIIMYPEMAYQDDEYKTYTTVHEIGHVLGASLNLDSSKEWTSISWEYSQEQNRVLRKSPQAFVSNYAKVDFFEDFAESFAAYRFSPEKLKAASLKKYNFMKEKVFSGFEFISEVSCPGML